MGKSLIRKWYVWLVVLLVIAAGARYLYIASGSWYWGDRKPYLQRPAPTEITVRWRTSEEVTAWLKYGPAPGTWAHTITEAEPAHEHEVRVTGLQPDTLYYYAVGSGETVFFGDEEIAWFRTFPESGVDKPARMWFLGDPGKPGDIARGVRDAARAWMKENSPTGNDRPDILILLGDNAYTSGTNRQYQAAIFDIYADVLPHIPCLSTQGNHDSRRWAYFEIFTFPEQGESGGVPSGSPHYYAVDYGHLHFVCLDSEEGDLAPNGPMLAWLKKDLAANRLPWLIAFWHHPPYSRGSHDSDDPGDSGGRMVAMREHFMPVLEAAGVDLVVTAHSHTYERSFLLDGHYGWMKDLKAQMILDSGDGRPAGDGPYRKDSAGLASHQGAVHVVIGSSSKVDDGPFDHPVMATGMAEAGSLVVDVRGLKLEAVFIDPHGRIRDHFTLLKGPVDDTGVRLETSSAEGPE
ncbi:MAG: metallophosphoesterase family protein [Acidobacteria bacterium]|nr:metallophosphoesterase family protein [Acidobacteriota bacterium]